MLAVQLSTILVESFQNRPSVFLIKGGMCARAGSLFLGTEKNECPYAFHNSRAGAILISFESISSSYTYQQTHVESQCCQ